MVELDVEAVLRRKQFSRARWLDVGVIRHLKLLAYRLLALFTTILTSKRWPAIIPLICLLKSTFESDVVWPCERRVTIFLKVIEIVLIFAVQLVLSTSIIICTIYPGVYPSFANDIVELVNPLFRQQQLVISPEDCFC